MKSITLIALMSCAFVSTLGIAQDIHYSQYWMNNIQYNPSLAGNIDGKLRANASYRNQWQESSPFTTYSTGVDTKFNASKNATIGFGGFFLSDIAGENRFVNNEGKLVLSSTLKIANKQKVSLGVGGGFIQKNVDWMNGLWNTQYQNGEYNSNLSNQENINTANSMKGDLSLGATYHYGLPQSNQMNPNPFQCTFGISVNHLLKPSFKYYAFSEDRLYRNVILHGEAQIQLANAHLSILPGYFIQFQGPSKEIVIGSQYRYAFGDVAKWREAKNVGFLNLGTHLRLNDAFITSIGLQFRDYIVGMSYDWNVSSYKRINQINGAFEINLNYQMNTIR